VLCNTTNLFTGNTDHCAFSEESGFYADTNNDRVAGVEHVLRIDAEFAREDGEVLELVAFLQQPLLAEPGEPVEQMVDDVGDEYVDADAVGHLLRLAFHLHVERHYHSVSTSQHTHNADEAILTTFSKCFSETFPNPIVASPML